MAKRKTPRRDGSGRFVASKRRTTRRNPLGGVLWDVGSNVLASHIYAKGMPRLRKSLRRRGIKHPLI